MTNTNDASFLKIVETVDGVEVDRTPKPEPPEPAETTASKKGGNRDKDKA